MNYDHIKLLIKLYEEILVRSTVALDSSDLVFDAEDIKTLSEAFIALSQVADQSEKIALYKKQMGRIAQ